MPRLVPWTLLALLLAACGDEPTRRPEPVEAGPGPWQHCRIEGLGGAGGLTVHAGDLLAVAGGNDREVYVVARADLAHGATVRARTLAVEITPQRDLMGAEAFALQGYKLQHLWALPLDFQAAAAQAPDFLYVVDRIRRVAFWGRLSRDAAGRLARVKFAGVTVVPGAARSGVDEGDWRDRGPGIAGLVSLPGSRRRTEDLCVLDRGVDADGHLRLRRLDRFGSVLGGTPLAHEHLATLSCNALSFDGARYVLHHGEGRGRLISFPEPEPLRAARLDAGTPGPDVAGVERWTGMAHDEQGTIYLVSGGRPAVLAWRRR